MTPPTSPPRDTFSASEGEGEAVFAGKPIARSSSRKLSPRNEDSLDRKSRREPEFFVVRRSRLFSLDRTLYMKGPRLYNYVNNKLREQRISLYPEQMVVTSYKVIVKTFLLDAQKSMEGPSWSINTLPLYSVL